MYFDRNRAMLIATPSDIDSLGQHAAGETSTIDQDWITANLTTDDPGTGGHKLDPTVAGIVQVLCQPDRSIVIERFDGQLVVLMFVAWERTGRATITEGSDSDNLIVTATELSLLPALLSQATRLRAGTPTSVRPPLTTSAKVIEQVFNSEQSSPATDSEFEPDLQAVLGSVSNAWRASGSWRGQETDTSATIFSAGAEGLWRVEIDDDNQTTTPDSNVTLHPISSKDALDHLGDVVTGRTSDSKPPQRVAAPSS